LQNAQLRKRRHGWQVSFLYGIIHLGSRELIRSGLKALSLCDLVQTAFVGRANLTLRELIATLSRRTWSLPMTGIICTCTFNGVWPITTSADHTNR
jgi:hypothetical protein